MDVYPLSEDLILIVSVDSNRLGGLLPTKAANGNK